MSATKILVPLIVSTLILQPWQPCPAKLVFVRRQMKFHVSQDSVSQIDVRFVLKLQMEISTTYLRLPHLSKRFFRGFFRSTFFWFQTPGPTDGAQGVSPQQISENPSPGCTRDPETNSSKPVSTWITRVGRFSFPFGVSASWLAGAIAVRFGECTVQNVSPRLLFGIPNFQRTPRGPFSQKNAPHKAPLASRIDHGVRMWCFVDTQCLLCCFF